jgi:hypothetical protein
VAHANQYTGKGLSKKQHAQVHATIGVLNGRGPGAGTKKQRKMSKRAASNLVVVLGQMK